MYSDWFRSSQPRTGINSTACPEDERILLAIRATAFEANNEVDSAVWYEDIEPGEGSMSSSWTNIRELGCKVVVIDNIIIFQ